jgi:DNA-binding NtrC family response regulator
LGKSILFVDDERPILNTLQRTLRGSEFDVFIAADGQTALELLDREPIDIIVSDMRMPNMNGHQLLRKVKELYPTTIRIIMSGHAETHDVKRTS